jgi:hypothetical protein
MNRFSSIHPGHFFLMLLLAALLTGCHQLPTTAPLPEGLTLARIGSVDAGAPFALSPDHTQLALGRGGLELRHLSTGVTTAVATHIPSALAWSGDGRHLAASFYRDGQSILASYDARGASEGSVSLAGRVTDLCWLADGELLAGGVVLTNYRFGSNYKTLLHRWRPGGEAASILLKESTLQPATMKRWAEVLERGPALVLAPDSRSLLYLHPYNPPLFTPYSKLMLRDLESGGELEIGQVSLLSGGGAFSGDGELVAFGDGRELVSQVNPWSGESGSTIKAPGQQFVSSPDGSYWLLDGLLYRFGSPVAMFRPGVTGRFAPDGTGLLVAHEGELYLVRGLSPRPLPEVPPAVLERLRQLRSWRSQGLIESAEYRLVRERIMKP